MKNKKLIKINILFFIFSVFFINNHLFATSEFREIKKMEAQEAAAAKPVITRPKVEYKASDFKDPFRPKVAKANEAGISKKKQVVLPDLKIQGIVWGGQIPQAVINDKVIKVGDTIQNVHIIDINKFGVLAVFEGQEFNISSPATGGGSKEIKESLEGGRDENE